MRKIVGAKIGSTITNSRKAIAQAIQLNTPMQLLDQDHMRMMSAFDLGINWDKMSESPVLFTLNDDWSVPNEMSTV